MAELRDLIAERLVDQGQHPWELRVAETGAMVADEGLPPFGILPFLVVIQTSTTVDQQRVETENYEVRVHAPNTSFAVLDGLERLVVQLLGAATLVDPDPTPPRTFTLEYAGTTLGDQVVEAWDAYVRSVRFTTSSAALGGPNTPDDPRARYLRENPFLLFCDPAVCVQTDPATWQPRDDCPGVYVRPTAGPVEVQRYGAATALRETLAIHVLAPTFREQCLWVDKLALELPGQLDYIERNVTDSNGRRPRISTLLTRVTGLNPAADPLTEGQLRIELTFSELACDVPELTPPLRQVGVVPRPPGGEGPPIELPRTPAPPIPFVIGRR